MGKSKSIIVTIIVTVMLAVIIAGLYKLNMRACMIIVTALAVFGYINFASDFYGWLSREPELLPPTEWESDEEFITTYEQIKAEMEDEHERL